MTAKMFKVFGEKNRPYFDQFFTTWKDRQDASKWTFGSWNLVTLSDVKLKFDIERYLLCVEILESL